MLGTLPFSTAPYSSSATLTSNGEIITLVLSLEMQEKLALSIEHAILEVALNISPQQDLVLDIAKS